MRLFSAIDQLRVPTLAVVAFVLLMTGCGQKEGLYQSKASMVDNELSSGRGKLMSTEPNVSPLINYTNN